MKYRVFFIVLLFIHLFIYAQESRTLPLGYRKITLGMTLENTKQELLKDSLFGYRGDRDVSLLPSSHRQVVIETSGSSFVSRSWFLFNDDKLYNMTINLNTEMIDYHSVFKTLCEKYGQPNSLNPEKCVWIDENVSMSLERPLAIKYYDVPVFNSLENNSTVKKSTEEFLRKDFLDSL